MLFGLLLVGLQGAALLQMSAAWRCGRSSECDCRKDLWIVCQDVKETPNFRPGLRRQRSLMLTIADGDEFDMGTLDLTNGFKDTVLMIDTLDQQFCREVIARHPWIRCIMQQTTPACKQTYDTSEPPMTTTEISPTPDQEIYTLNLEASVSFGLEKVTIGSEANQKSFAASLKPWLKSPTLFWSCVTVGIALVAMILVICSILLSRNRRNNIPLGVRCLDCLCKLCLCPCKCLDKLRSREMPYYERGLPTQYLPCNDSSESVELYNASTRKTNPC